MHQPTIDLVIIVCEAGDQMCETVSNVVVCLNRVTRYDGTGVETVFVGFVLFYVS